MEVPGQLLYTKEHEWIRKEADGSVTVGITDFAQHELGDVCFVDLPAVGRALKSHESFGSVESVKAVSDVFSPITGQVTAVNETLASDPEAVNKDPYGGGWLIRLQPADPTELSALMDAAAYTTLTAH